MAQVWSEWPKWGQNGPSALDTYNLQPVDERELGIWPFSYRFASASS